VITPNSSPEVGSQVITPNPIADVAPSDIVDRSIYTRGYRLRDWRYRRLTQKQPIMYVQTDAIFTTTCLGSRRYTSGLAHVSYRHIMVFYRSRIHVQQPFLAPDSTWTPQALSLPRSQPLKRFHEPFLYVKKELTEKYPHLNLYLVDASTDTKSRTLLTINEYTSEEQYQINKQMNVQAVNILSQLKKEDPAFFDQLVIKMQASQADHLCFKAMLSALGIDREAASTILLSPEDHQTINKIDFTRPHEVEDVHTWLDYLGDKTLEHFTDLYNKGELASGFDIEKLKKSLDKGTNRDRRLFRESDYGLVTNNIGPADFFTIVEDTDDNIRSIIYKLRTTSYHKINQKKVREAVL